MGLPRPGRRDQTSLRVFFALVAVVYLSVYPYLQAINNPNENTRVYLVMALVDEGTFQLDGIVRRYGWTNDMAKVPDVRAPGGSHLASVKGPAMSYLGVPVYLAQKALLRLRGQRPPGAGMPLEAAAWLRTTTLTLQFFCVHLPCFLFLVWFETRLRRWSRDIVLRLSAVAAVGLGTNYLAYSLVFVSHAWSAVAVFVALDCIAEERRRASRGDRAAVRTGAALVAGLAAGFVTLLEYQGAFLSIVLGIYALSVFYRPRALAAFSAGAALSLSLLLLFQWRSFGNPLTPGHRMMQDASYGALVNSGFLGFKAPSLPAASALLFDRGFGLFGTSPFLWTGLLGAPLLLASARGVSAASRERRTEGSVALALCAVLTLSISASVIWRGGWTIGPRYLGALPPLLALLGLGALEWVAARGQRELARLLAAGLAIASFVQGGAIGLLVSTLPEEIVRPLPQVLWPLVRLSIVPHHALESLGVMAAWPWFVAPLSAGLALLVVLLSGQARRPTPRRHASLLFGRLLVAPALALVALVPALGLPLGEADHGPEVRAFFYDKWEPAGRDALARARARAETEPCVSWEVAKDEQILGRPLQAASAHAQAEGCTKRQAPSRQPPP